MRNALLCRKKTSRLFHDFDSYKYNSAVIREVLDAGFEVGQSWVHPKSHWILTWDAIKKFNVIVMVGTPNTFTEENAKLLDRYLEEGGGILFMPCIRQKLHWTPPRRYFKERLGLEVFVEQIKCPENTYLYPARGRNLPMAWTDEIVKSPITEGVRTLWYPVNRGDFYYSAAPLWLSPEWTALVKTGAGAYSVTPVDKAEDKGSIILAYKADEVQQYGNFKGRKGDFTIVAVRDLLKGRVAAVAVSPQFLLWSGYIPMYNGVLMKTGAQGKPSDWSKLFINLYKYLAEPSLANGKLGGYVTKPENVFSTPPGDPPAIEWDKTTFPPPAKKVQIGVAGAQSRLSSGKQTVTEWCAKARQKGFDFLVFLEDMRAMNEEKWIQLRGECKANSDTNFLAFPGIVFETEGGDRGFYIDDLGYWPDRGVFTRDGRVRSSRGDPQSGDLKSTGMWWLYFRLGMKLPANQISWHGVYEPLGYFSHAANSQQPWDYKLYSLFAVHSRAKGRIIDNWTVKPYLEVQAERLLIAPFALDLMDDVKDLPAPFEKDAVCLTYAGSLDKLHHELCYLGTYNSRGLSSPVAVSSAPRIREWTWTGDSAYRLPRWLTGPKESDFYVTPNYRVRLRLAVDSDEDLDDVIIYDGTEIIRRFSAQGKKHFNITLDCLHDQHRNFTAVVRDKKGRQAITGTISTENWLNRIYWCGDRINFGNKPYEHGYGIPNPVWTTTLGDERCLLAQWKFKAFGTDCGIIEGNVERMYCKGAYPDAGGNAYFDAEPIPDFTWIKNEYQWYQSHGKRFLPKEEYQLQGWDQAFNYPLPENTNAPFFPYVETEDIFTFKQPVTFDGQTDGYEQWSIEPVVHYGGSLDTNQVNTLEIRSGSNTTVVTIPTTGKGLALNAKIQSGSVFALRFHSNGSERQMLPVTAIVYGDGLSYRFGTWGGGKFCLFQIGWQENGLTVKQGTTRAVRVFTVRPEFLGRGMSMLEFSGPEAAFSAGQMDHFQKGDWYQASRGTVTETLLPLGITADNFSIRLSVPKVPFPINSLPVKVSGLNPFWTAYYCEPATPQKRRPVAVSEKGKARVQFDARKQNVTLWVGHPLICDSKDIRFWLIDVGNGIFILDINNAGERDVKATFQSNKDCPFVAFTPLSINVPAGAHVKMQWENGIWKEMENTR